MWKRRTTRSFMREIYEYADTVFVWLGEDTAERDAEECFELLERLSAEPTVRFMAAEMSFDELETATEIKKVQEMTAAKMPESDRPIYTKLETLLQRSWFSRTWIIQEIVVGHHPTVYCGSAKISWKSFTRGIDQADSLNRLDKPSSFTTLYEGRLDFQTGAWAMDLLNLLERHRSALAKDERDKVFAFLGLSRQIHGKDVGIVIDYGLSTGKLYTAVTRRALEVMPTLDVLSYPHVRERQKYPMYYGFTELGNRLDGRGSEGYLRGGFPALGGRERVRC
jgi:Heterokaryon incompatibility protein (HET)